MKKRNTDTIPAMLSPHEAVLNRKAADLLGRDKIKKLNAKGNAMERSRKYQGGTDDVPVAHPEQLPTPPVPRSTFRTPIMNTLDRYEAWQASNEADWNQRLDAGVRKLAGHQRGTSDVGRDDRADLLAEASNTFYGGGHAPAPTPTPTPKPRGYQYGTSNVQRGIDYASSPTASPTGAQGFGGSPTAQMGGSPGNLSTNSIPYGGSGSDPIGQGGGFNPGAPTYTGAPGGFPTGGTTYPYGYQPPGPSGTNPNINVTAGSKGVSPLSSPVPDFRYADPNTLKQLDISNLIYDPNAGGYRHADYPSGPLGGGHNEFYKGESHMTGVDANANRAASAYYNYIGGLPTMPRGTPALNQLYGMTGQSPTPGPSYNSILSQYANNPLAKQAGFGPTYKGPYGFGG